MLQIGDIAPSEHQPGETCALETDVLEGHSADGPFRYARNNHVIRRHADLSTTLQFPADGHLIVGILVGDGEDISERRSSGGSGRLHSGSACSLLFHQKTEMLLALACLCLTALDAAPTDSVFELTCAKSLRAQVARSGIRSFTLPDYSTLAECPGRFCLLRKPLALASTTLQGLPTVAIQQSICLMEDDCDVEALRVFYNSMCGVPRCSDFSIAEEQSLCMLIQSLECNPRSRMTYSQIAANSSTQFRCNTDSAYEEVVIPSMIACGSTTLANLKYLMMSGGLQDLGDFDGCRVKAPELSERNNYCTVKYYQSLTSGRCLPTECDQHRLNLLLREICTPNFSCLEHANIIPLDFCVTSRFLGCGAAASFAILERMSLTDALMGPASHGSSAALVKDLNAAQTFEDLNPEALAHFLQHISNRTTQAIRMVDPAALPIDLHANFDGSVGKLMRPYFVPDKVHQRRVMSEDDIVLSSETNCTFEPVSRAKADWYIWIASTLGVFIILPALALLFKHYLRPNCCALVPAFNRFLTAFRVDENISTMLQKRDKYATGTWSHTCGLRVLSMIWVVSGHAFAFAGLSVVHNSGAFVEMLSSWTFQGILSGQLAVDTFFFLSGFMLYISGIDRIRKSNTHTLLTYCRLIFQRWWRLAGLLAFVLVISYYGIQYLNYGPQWPAVLTMLRTGYYGGCTKWWWTNMLFVNNLEWTKRGFSECFPHGWYLACDFQFAVLGTALLFISAKGSPRVFLSVVTALLVGALGICIYVVAANDLRFPFGAISIEANADTRSLQEGAMRSWHLFYVRPWTRIPPYLVGLWAAALHESGSFARWLQKEPTQRPSSPTTEHLVTYHPTEDKRGADTILVIMGHAFFASVMIVLVYILPYQANRHGALEWNRVLEVLYMACQRCVWAVCVAWFTLSLAAVPLKTQVERPVITLRDGVSSVLKKVLSGRLMALTSLGVYGTYLVHPLIQMAYYGSARQSAGLTEGVGYIVAIAQTVLGLSVGALLHLFVEIPLARIL